MVCWTIERLSESLNGYAIRLWISVQLLEEGAEPDIRDEGLK